MEEQPSTVTSERLFCGSRQQYRTSKVSKMNVGKFEQMQWTKANERIKPKMRQSLSSCYNSLEMPMHATEFLCRSWSPSATDFLQALSPNNQVWGLDDKLSLGKRKDGTEANDGDRGDQVDDDDDGKEHELKSHIAGSGGEGNLPDRTLENSICLSKNCTSHAGCLESNTFRFLPQPSLPLQSKVVVGKSMQNVLQTCTTRQDHYKISMKYMKEFLKGNSLSSILRQHKENKKEEVRLVTAKMHAALSVAQLAAAIAGIVSTERAKNNDKEMMTRDTNFENMVASAAAMVASACAESAELSGVGKAYVASAVSSGLAAQSPGDLLTLIATAATCLRGAATLNSRAVPGLNTPMKKDFKLEARLSIITPSGQRVDRLVTIRPKQGQLRLSLEKKYLGILVTSKEYTIRNVVAEKRSSGFYLLSINCEGGEIKLLFKDEKQSIVWMSSISSVLNCEQISMAKI